MRFLKYVLVLVWISVAPVQAQRAQDELTAAAQWSQTATEVQMGQLALFDLVDLFDEVFMAWDAGEIGDAEAESRLVALRAQLDAARRGVIAQAEALPPPPRFRTLRAIQPAYQTMYDSIGDGVALTDTFVDAIGNVYETVQQGGDYDETQLALIVFDSGDAFIRQQQSLFRAVSLQLPGDSPRGSELRAGVAGYDGLLALNNANRQITVDGSFTNAGDEITALRTAVETIRSEVRSGLDRLRTTRDTLRMLRSQGREARQMADLGLEVFSTYEETFDNHLGIAEALSRAADAMERGSPMVDLDIETTLIEFERLEMANATLQSARMARISQ